MIASALLALAALTPASPLVLQGGENYLPWLLERLESPDPEIRASSYHALLTEKDAPSACVQGFSAASPLAREIRAQVLLERGGDGQVETALELLRKDPDRQVCSTLLRFLGRAELNAASAPARCAAAGELGLEDGAIAATAIEILQRMEYPCASQSLLSIVRRHPSRETRETALKSLLRRWTGGSDLFDLANDPGLDRSFLPPVLLALGDRSEPRASALFRRHWDDSDLRLRAAARQAFSILQSRRAQRNEVEQALADFRALREACGDRPEILLEQGQFSLLHVPRSVDVGVLAQTALAKLQEKPDRDRATMAARAQLLAGASHLLRQEAAAADRDFAAGIDSLAAVLRCIDDSEEPEQGYAASILVGKCWSLRALNSMAASSTDLPSATSCWQAAYRASQDCQRYRDDWIFQERKKRGSWPYNMDEILGGDLGFFSVMERPLVRDWGKDRAEKLWRDTAAMLTVLDPDEFPPVLADVETKPRLSREREKRLPSDFPVRLADFFESTMGKSADALAVYQKLAQAWRLRLNDFPGFSQDVARVESRIASLHMDRREAEDAEAALRRALGLLEDLSALVQARSGDGSDTQIQAQMGTIYVSLAVNENVVKRRPEEARAHLEKAFSLDPSPFNRVLFACYEARAGKTESARRTLDLVDPEPALFYNLACTHALLGDKEKSLSFLEKHLRIALRGAGERRRGAEWARKDPDLESLRGNEKFESLLREAEWELQGSK